MVKQQKGSCEMPRMKVSILKQAPYGFVLKGGRVDPTRQGIQRAIEEGRFSKKIMDQDYNAIAAEIINKTQDPVERSRLMHEFHNERIAELVRTKETWLNKPEAWPIKVNQFNQVIEGNHRFRAIRYLELDDVEVVVVQEPEPRQGFALPEIW
jgi:hypothetical protein